jgi:hypothetical protein
MVDQHPQLASCITGCLQVSEDLCIRLFNTPIIKDNERSKPERAEVFEGFKNIHMKIIRGMDSQQRATYLDINASIADAIDNELNVLIVLYKTKLTQFVKYEHVEDATYYLLAKEFIVLAQMYYLKMFGRENRFINRLMESLIKFADRIDSVSLNPNKPINIESEVIKEQYMQIITKIVKLTNEK